MAFFTTAIQYLFRSLLLLTLPPVWLNATLYVVILRGAGIGLLVLLILYRQFRNENP